MEDFDEFAVARWPRLVRAAVLLGCAHHEAEDVAQTALARCLTKWSKVRGADNPDAYVHRILVRTFIDSRRRRWTAERPTEVLPEMVVADSTVGVDVSDALKRSLVQLTADQRIAVVLRYYLHLSEAEMADALNVAPGTVKSRLSRALHTLAADPNLADYQELP